MPCCMQEWERKWPSIMTIGHVFHRGPEESGPPWLDSCCTIVNQWFTIVQQESNQGVTAGGGRGRGGAGGGGGGRGGVSAKIRKQPGFQQL
jgi:hypothetical protein